MAIKLWRVWLGHRRRFVNDAVRVAARNEGEARRFAIKEIRERAKDESSVYHDLGLDLMPKEWEVTRVEEIPSL